MSIGIYKEIMSNEEDCTKERLTKIIAHINQDLDLIEDRVEALNEVKKEAEQKIAKIVESEENGDS
jgi:hypothetical protein